MVVVVTIGRKPHLLERPVSQHWHIVGSIVNRSLATTVNSAVVILWTVAKKSRKTETVKLERARESVVAIRYATCLGFLLLTLLLRFFTRLP